MSKINGLTPTVLRNFIKANSCYDPVEHKRFFIELVKRYRMMYAFNPMLPKLWEIFWIYNGCLFLGKWNTLIGWRHVLSDETLRESSARCSVISDACIPLPTCTPSKYRLVDGSCNNLKKPLMGRSFIKCIHIYSYFYNISTPGGTRLHWRYWCLSSSLWWNKSSIFSLI